LLTGCGGIAQINRVTTQIPMNRVVYEKIVAQLGPLIFKESLIVSPDNKHVAYVTLLNNAVCIVVHGKEEKEYDAIGKNSLIFSPDSKHIAYGAKVSVGNHQKGTKNNQSGSLGDGERPKNQPHAKQTDPVFAQSVGKTFL
jgi:hypothetical protein